MRKYRNWRDFYPPMIPIYFIDYKAMKTLLEKDILAISKDALLLMESYFEEMEEYEKLELTRWALKEQKALENKAIDSKIRNINVRDELSNFKFSKN